MKQGFSVLKIYLTYRAKIIMLFCYKQDQKSIDAIGGRGASEGSKSMMMITLFII